MKNVQVEYVAFTQNAWDNILNAFEEFVNKDFDGIIAPAFSEQIVPLIDIASQKNIPVMIFNSDVAVSSKRIAYFGPNINEAGTLAADFMVKALNGRGNVAIIRGADIYIYRTRIEGIKERLKSIKRIKLVADIEGYDVDEGFTDNDTVYNEVKNLLRQNPNIHGLFITGLGVRGAARAVKELNMVGEIKIVCFDFDREIFELIKEGAVYASIGQDPFGQGHDPIVYLYNYLVDNKKLESQVIWTRTDVVYENNVNDLI